MCAVARFMCMPPTWLVPPGLGLMDITNEYDKGASCSFTAGNLPACNSNAVDDRCLCAQHDERRWYVSASAARLILSSDFFISNVIMLLLLFI